MNRLELLVEELKALPPHKLAEAERAIRALRSMPSETIHAGLASTAGTLSKEETDEWERIINEDCRQLDGRSWSAEA